MRKVGHDRYKCALCGAALAVSDETRVRTMIVMTGGQPTARAVLVDGKEIHRCPTAAG